MRFIKLETDLEKEGEGAPIEFDEKTSILHIRDNDKFNLFKSLFREIFSLSSDYKAKNERTISFNLHVLYNNVKCRLDSRGGITDDRNMEDETSHVPENRHITLSQYLEYFSNNIFPMLSYIETGNKTAPEIDPESLNTAFINMEMLKLNIPVADPEKLLKEKEQELSELIKNKELIEIKKMRKEKLQKEISSVTRVLNRLNRNLKSLEDFRETLNSISEKIAIKDKLASKTNKWKKDVLNLRELKDRLNNLEKELKNEFPQFKNYTENLADLEEVEKSFNTLKDINSRIDSIKNSAGIIRKRASRIAGGITVFSITALLFLSVKGDTEPILFIGSASVITVLLTFIISYFKIKKYNPESLTDEKEIHQKKLTESLGSSSFSFESYKTEELYEFLLQYFDDFIKFSEIQSEISSLKEEMSSLPGLRETEKKLETQNSEISAIEKDISGKLESLDSSIIAVEDIENISGYISEINDLIESAENEIRQQDSIRKKIENEIADYDKKDNTGISFTVQLDEINEKIQNAENEKTAMSYLHNITRDSFRKWSLEKTQALSHTAGETLKKILPDYGLDDETRYLEALHHFISHGEKTSPVNEIPGALIQASIIDAFEKVTESSHLLPPLILEVRENSDEKSSFEKITKNVLELFPERQVIIITSATIPGISGKITDI